MRWGGAVGGQLEHPLVVPFQVQNVTLKHRSTSCVQNLEFFPLCKLYLPCKNTQVSHRYRILQGQQIQPTGCSVPLSPCWV